MILVPVVCQDPPVFQEVRKAGLVPLVLLVLKVCQVFLVHPEKTDSPVTLVPAVCRAMPEDPASPESRAAKVHLARRVTRVTTDFRVCLVSRAQRATQEPQAPRVNLVRRASPASPTRVSRAWTAAMVSTASQAPRERGDPRESAVPPATLWRAFLVDLAPLDRREKKALTGSRARLAHLELQAPKVRRVEVACPACRAVKARKASAVVMELRARLDREATRELLVPLENAETMACPDPQDRLAPRVFPADQVAMEREETRVNQQFSTHRSSRRESVRKEKKAYKDCQDHPASTAVTDLQDQAVLTDFVD